jgi:hypothetical protein
MKRFASCVVAALALAACSPQVYPLYLEVRQPSSSGLDLSRKSMGIVYMDSTHPADSSFDRSAASALARTLEEDYFGGAEEVGLFRTAASDTVSLETMHSLVMDTGKDVIFLLSSHLGTATEDGALPVSTRLVVYDSMGQDKMNRYTGSAVVPAPKGEGAPSQAEVVGERISARFLSKWKTESFSFYYFDQLGSDWEQPIEYVEEGKIGKAIDAWSVLVKKGNALQRGCAAYNLAMAFYLLEDYEMSVLWLDYADKLESISLSAGLRARLAPHLEKIQK